jgi:hypothetical protein
MVLARTSARVRINSSPARQRVYRQCKRPAQSRSSDGPRSSASSPAQKQRADHSRVIAAAAKSAKTTKL